MLTVERLRALLEYDPLTGIFTWRAVHKGTLGVGSRAGCVNRRGYVLISIDYQKLYAHRLAWLYVHGEWPTKGLDHKNGDRTDNRIANLREATQSQNLANRGMAPDNTSGIKGVRFDEKRGYWAARIKVAGKQQHLGYFDNAADAQRAYERAAVGHFGEFARVS